MGLRPTHRNENQPRRHGDTERTRERLRLRAIRVLRGERFSTERGVLQDPTGAVFTVWEPKKSQGIGIAHVDGTLCWADLSTPDPQRASKFYSDLFGWQIVSDDEDPEHNYLHIKNGEAFHWRHSSGVASPAQ